MGNGNDSGGRAADVHPANKPPIAGIQLYCVRNGKATAVELSPGGGINLFLAEQPTELLIPSVTLGAADGLIFQAPGQCTDMWLLINNRTAAQLNLTLNHTTPTAAGAAGAAAAGNEFLSAFALGPKETRQYPENGMRFGMNSKDQLRGLGNGAIVFVYGRRVLR